MCVCVFGAQVSEVYSLHRQTAYLAQDYFDRFMLTQDDVGKEYLQLLGITALFIASKIEVSLAPPPLYPHPAAGIELKPVANGPKMFLSAGNLPTQGFRLRLRHGRSLRRGRHPADGAPHTKGW